jgi:hypothetical protein
MSDTIPLSFEAVDNLTRHVETMTAALGKLAAGHEKQEDAAEDAETAQKSLGETLSEVADITAISERATALAGFAWEKAGAAYEQLTGLLDSSLAAWDEQSKKSGKSASALGSVAESSAKLEKEATKVLAQLGKMIERSGTIQVTYTITAGVLKEVRDILKEVDEEGKKTGDTLGGDLANGAIGFFSALEENSGEVAQFIVQLGLIDDGIGYILTNVALLGAGLKVDFYELIRDGARDVDALLNAIEQLAAVSGTDLPDAFYEARNALRTVSVGADALSREALVGLVEANEAVEESVAGILREASQVDEVQSRITRLAAAGKKAAEDAKKALDKGGEKRRGDLVSPEEAAAEARAAALLDLDRQILQARRAKNEELAIELEREKGLVELGQSLREIKTSTLKLATEQAESLRIQTEYEAALADLEQARADDRRAAYELDDLAWRERLAREEEADEQARERYEETIARIQARYDYETEQLTLMGDTIAESVGHIPELLNDISASTERMLGGFAKAAAGITPLIASMRAYNAVGATTRQQQDALNAGLQAGVGILSGVTASFVEDKKTQAGIEALINAAAAAAAYATGNIPQGIGYTAAAAGYAAAAAFGGGSSGSAPSVGGSAGSAGPAAFGSPDLDRERALTAEAIAEAINEQGRGGGVVINVDFGNSLIAGDSPQAARIITDLIAPELAQMVRREP